MVTKDADQDGGTGGPGAARIFRHGQLEIDLHRISVSVGGRRVSITGRQLRLLLHLARNPDAVFTRAQLIEEIWDPAEAPGDAKAIDVLVCRLRKKLGAAAGMVMTVRSAGYRLSTRGEAP